jgi:DNA gyrase subunit A
MSEIAKEIISVSLESEMKQSYLDYAMSVIVGRALPDVRDGLKPVHRRVLFAMSELGNDWNKAYKKSARVVGDVIGKYHPHGDTAVYDTMVRMAQTFSMRYVLIDGQGNFGSVDGDSPAAMRYTEVRMARLASELLADLEKDTVDFAPNYDGSEKEPVVFPSRIPNLLINGQTGIAVGMATNIPPHNLTEVVNATIALLDSPSLSIVDLMTHVPAPDFPTAGIIYGVGGLRDAYETGRGRVVMRARAHFEEKNNKNQIVVTELPYQVNKAKLIERIAEMVKEKQIEGITGLRDESDKDGMRMVIEVRRGESLEVLLNQLYKTTLMQTAFNFNMVAIVDGQPRLLNLKQILEYFIRHRRDVVTRRSRFELRKARDRAHLLEGLTVALSNVDEMIDLIKQSPTPPMAKQSLLERAWSADKVLELLERAEEVSTRPEHISAEFGMSDKGYYLSPEQAQAILDLRLQRLTGLEQDKIFAEYGELLNAMLALLEILRNPVRLTEVVREELVAVVTQYGDKRKSEIEFNAFDMTREDLIPQEDLIVTLSDDGYIKAQSVSDYRAQRRGGRGKTAASVKETDNVGQVIVAHSHATLLCFSNRGKLYWLRTFDIPQASRTARGRPINNLLPLEANELITSVLPVASFEGEHYVFMATAAGVVKKTELVDFSRPRTAGIIALGLDDGDSLVQAVLTNGNQDVMLLADNGKAIRFHEGDVRAMGRGARGVRGMTLSGDSKVVSLQLVQEGLMLLTATANGYGKCTLPEEYSTIGRGGQGVISIKTSDRNGQVVAAVMVDSTHEVVLISDKGTLVRTRVSEMPVLSRNTQGVKLINLTKDELLVGVAVVDAEEEVAEQDDESVVDAVASDAPDTTEVATVADEDGKAE